MKFRGSEKKSRSCSFLPRPWTEALGGDSSVHPGAKGRAPPTPQAEHHRPAMGSNPWPTVTYLLHPMRWAHRPQDTTELAIAMACPGGCTQHLQGQALSRAQCAWHHLQAEDQGEVASILGHRPCQVADLQKPGRRAIRPTPPIIPCSNVLTKIYSIKLEKKNCYEKSVMIKRVCNYIYIYIFFLLSL